MPEEPNAKHRTSQQRVVVIGAGAFGGWTALELRKRGAAVTLIDAWGPGNARASSGGETRLIRATYGPREIYTTMAQRAMQLWREADATWAGEPILHRTGVLWMFGEDDSFGRASADVLHRNGAQFDALALPEASRRYPQVNFDGVSSIFFEPDAGFLLARRGCEQVVERFRAAGGVYRPGAVATPTTVEAEHVTRILLTDGSSLEADAFVFACGPWLPAIFPDAIGPRIKVTRQEVFYFGAPAGDSSFDVSKLPSWIDLTQTQVYGVPVHGASGFKVADDTSGPSFDPSSYDRHPTKAGIDRARKFLLRRFPALRDASLLNSEVCQYESTPDDHFIVDRHPGAANIWIVGGGSGHGYKMGPAIGEMVASIVLDGTTPNPLLTLARLEGKPDEGWSHKWSEA